VWRQPFLRAAVGVIGGINLVFNAHTLVLIVRARELGASPALIGGMFAFLGVGGLLGSFVAPWTGRRFGARTVIVTVGWLWVAQIGALTLLPNALSLGAVSGAGSFAGPAFNVVVNSHIYSVTPDRLLGRVRSAARLIAWGSIPLGALAGGFLASAFGAQTTLLILTGIMCAVVAAACFARGMRQLTPSSPVAKHPGNQLIDGDRDAPDLNSRGEQLRADARSALSSLSERRHDRDRRVVMQPLALGPRLLAFAADAGALVGTGASVFVPKASRSPSHPAGARRCSYGGLRCAGVSSACHLRGDLGPTGRCR
jgi:MFS family permease